MKVFTAEKNRKASEEISSFYGGLPYGVVMKLFRKKDVKVNGMRLSKDAPVRKGDKIEVYYDGERKEKPFEPFVLYSDENLLAVYKPRGIETLDFAEKLSSCFGSVRPVHRLDRNTDGILLFALNDGAEEELKKALKERTFEKFYLAEVYGRTEKDSERLSAWLKKDSKTAFVSVCDKKTEGALPIITAYKTIKRGSDSSLLEVELITGRTHQIRAHLSHIGHFILGDGKYGKESINRKFGAKTQRLTAYRLILHFPKNSMLGYLDKKEIVLPQDKLDF